MMEIARKSEQVRSLHKWCRKLAEQLIDEDGLNRDQIVSRTALDKLDPVEISELAVNQRNLGKSVMLRVLKEGYSRAECSWFSVVSDTDGNVIGLALYNYPLDEVFAPGTVLIIKEPYFKYKMGFPFIRCDCPSDILVSSPFLPEYREIAWNNPVVFEDPLVFDPAPRSPGEWRELGKELFEKNMLVLARKAYFKSWKMCDINDPSRAQILLNRLQVESSLGCYGKVIKLANWFPNEDEALFHKGKAHYMLREYENAVSAFRDAIEELKKTGKLDSEECEDRVKEIREMLKRAETRVEEAKGNFSVDYIINKSKENPFQEIDYAEINILKKYLIVDKRISLILDAELKKDKIVMISKSWATAFRNEQDVEKDATEMKNGKKMERKWEVDDYGLRARVVSKLTKLLFKNPNRLNSLLLDFYSRKSEPIQWFCDPNEKIEPICDVERINDVCVSNCFTMRHAKSNAVTGSGLFYLPSFLKHSCEPNVDYKFYNDVMVVTALKDMAVGTELTINHVPFDLSYRERTKYLKARGFKCTCSKCVNKI